MAEKPRSPLISWATCGPEVRQNEDVTVKLNAPGLSLTVLARALQSGSMGEVINIRNMQSNRIVQGEVIGAGLVKAVSTNTHLIARAN